MALTLTVLEENGVTLASNERVTLTVSQAGPQGPAGPSGGVTDHGDLTGLGDDDHQQYATVGPTVFVSTPTTLSGLPRNVVILSGGSVTMPATIGVEHREWVVSNSSGVTQSLDGGALGFTVGATFNLPDGWTVSIRGVDLTPLGGAPAWGVGALFQPGSLPVAGLTAGYNAEVSDNNDGTWTVAERKTRVVPVLTMNLFDGANASNCMQTVAGDPANVTRPTVSTIDGDALAGPRVMGVKDALTSAYNGFWEVFVVAANGTNGDYLEPADFASPQPSPGDIYFQRVTELNSRWTDDAIYGGTPVWVPNGTTYGGTFVVTAADGLDCNFVQLDIVGGAGGGSGDVTGPSSSVNGRAAIFSGTTGKVIAQASAAPMLVGDAPTTHKTSHATGGTDALAPSDIGAVPTSRTVAGKALSADVTLTASDVSAVPTTRTVNSKALSADITLTASDVGAVATGDASVTNARVPQWRRLTFSDAAYNLGSAPSPAVSGSVVLQQTGTLTAARIVTLPAASAVPAGGEVIINAGAGCSATNTLTIARAGSDLINGSSSSLVIGTAWGQRRLVSDGTSAWAMDDGIVRRSQNLADLADAPTARTNLGLGTAATVNTGTGATNAILGNDSRLTDSRTPSGSAGGDLTGTYPNPTIASAAVTSSKVSGGLARVQVVAASKIADVTSTSIYVGTSLVPVVGNTASTLALPLGTAVLARTQHDGATLNRLVFVVTASSLSAGQSVTIACFNESGGTPSTRAWSQSVTVGTGTGAFITSGLSHVMPTGPCWIAILNPSGNAGTVTFRTTQVVGPFASVANDAAQAVLAVESQASMPSDLSSYTLRTSTSGTTFSHTAIDRFPKIIANAS